MDPWRNLVEAFVDGDIDAATFETDFIKLHSTVVSRGESVRFAVDRLFYEVDAYCADPHLRGPEDIDEAQLRVAAKEALSDWDRPWPPLPGR